MTLATIDQARARTAQLRRAGTVQAGLAPDFAAHARDTLGLLEVTRRRARLDALAAAADAHMGASDAAWADGLDRPAAGLAERAVSLAQTSGDPATITLARTWTGALLARTGRRRLVCDALAASIERTAPWAARAAADAHLAASLAWAGEAYPALATLERAEGAAGRAADAPTWAAGNVDGWLLVRHAVVYELLGMHQRAEAALGQRLAGPSRPMFAAHNRLRLALVLRASGERDEAARLLADVRSGTRLPPVEAAALAALAA